MTHRQQSAAYLALAATACLSVFLYYNLVYLPSFAQHRQLYESWHLAWTLSSSTAWLAYGPIGLVAACRLWHDRATLRERDYFLLVSFCVAIALAMHDRFIPARQPLHFIRGYVWMPLCLLALPTLQRWCLQSRRSCYVTMAMLAVGCLDNVTFCVVYAQDRFRSTAGARTTSREEQSLFAYLQARDATGVLACADRRLTYLSAVYSGVRPYMSHLYLTPEASKKIERQSEWFLGKPDEALERHVEFAVIPTSDTATFQNAHTDWHRLQQFGDWCLMQKKSHRPLRRVSADIVAP